MPVAGRYAGIQFTPHLWPKIRGVPPTEIGALFVLDYERRRRVNHIHPEAEPSLRLVPNRSPESQKTGTDIAVA